MDRIYQKTLFVVCLATLCSIAARAQPGGPPMFTVKTAPAEVRDLAPSLEFTGSIEPWRIIELSAQVSGVVESIPVEEGQALLQGEVVCKLDTDAVEIEIRGDRAVVESAAADLNRLKTGYREEEIQEALKNVEANQALFERAKDDWERQKPLVKMGVTTLSEGIRFEALLNEADASLESSKARLALLQAGYREEEVEIARAKWEMNRAELADATRRLALHTICAPMACVVTERLKEPGEWVDVGDAVAQMVVLDPLRVRIEVPQVYLSKIAPGLESAIEVDGLPDRRFAAEVNQVVPRAGSATRNFPVLMRLENKERILKSGLFARVRLSLGEKRPSVVVPRESILIRGESLVVVVAAPVPAQPAPTEETQPSTSSGPGGPPGGGPKPDAIIREVEVRTGGEVDNLVAVEVVQGEPIEEGDSIVILGGTRLASGMPVKILREELGTEEGAQASSAAGGTP